MRHLTPEIQATITGSSINTHLIAIPAWMTKQLQVQAVQRPPKAAVE
jgi:hypothetical protein